MISSMFVCPNQSGKLFDGLPNTTASARKQDGSYKVQAGNAIDCCGESGFFLPVGRIWDRADRRRDFLINEGKGL